MEGPRIPFLIVTALGDGTEAEVPASSYAELGELLGRMADAWEGSMRRTPAAVIWRMDRGAPRPMSAAELEEGDLHRLPILAV
jgi:hypothetical protein